MNQIAVVGYSKLNSQINKIKHRYPGIQFDMLEVNLDRVVDTVKQYYTKHNNCVFISSGANARIISENLDVPFVEINSTGYDLLTTFGEIRLLSNHVMIATYKEKLPYLSKVKHIFNIDYTERVYHDQNELKMIIDECKEKGIHDIIGSSMVCETAEKNNIRSYMLWSEPAICYAIDNAISIYDARESAIENVERLKTLLNFAHEGIIVTDRDGTIELFNSKAERLIGVRAHRAIGSNITRVVKNTRIDSVLKDGRAELNQIHSLNDVKILTNRVPIIIDNETVGAIATFQQLDAVQKAEEEIRKSLSKKGFIAKITFDDILRQSPKMEKVIQMAKRYAKTDASVVIRGDNGTGKELLAQSIHNYSMRKGGPFVAINCGAIAPSLLESELFGYEGGAFTGALKSGKRGIFEIAHKGTLFLDEIGEMPLEIQTKLLRVLEQKQIMRVGGETIVSVDVRIIAATNKNLYDMVERGEFRADLYYRLNVLGLNIPSLNDRKEDIVIIGKKLLQENRRDISDEEAEKIGRYISQLDYSWPGNVRELRNIIERFSSLYNLDEDAYQLLDQCILLENEPREKSNILEALNKYEGRKKEAADYLGISRTTLWRKMKELGIED